MKQSSFIFIFQKSAGPNHAIYMSTNTIKCCEKMNCTDTFLSIWLDCLTLRHKIKHTVTVAMVWLSGFDPLKTTNSLVLQVNGDKLALLKQFH